jgi:hypothetical protein
MDVFVSKRGYVPFRVRGWNVNAEQPIEARLTRGRDLRVELVDPKARPIVAEKLEAEIEGFGAPGKIEEGSPGVYTLCDLPAGSARITVRVAGTQYVRTADAHAGAAQVVLPEFGRVEVTWPFEVTKDGSSDYQLALRPTGSEGASQTLWTPNLNGSKARTFDFIVPGEYTIGLERGTEETEDGAPRQFSPLHPPARIHVTGGETSTVTLSP